MTIDEYMSISCYPWMEQMQRSDSVTHMVIRLPWVKANRSYQMLYLEIKSRRHLELLVLASLHAMAREITLRCGTET
jgi:hypothetical protein